MGTWCARVDGRLALTVASHRRTPRIGGRRPRLPFVGVARQEAAQDVERVECCRYFVRT